MRHSCATRGWIGDRLTVPSGQASVLVIRNFRRAHFVATLRHMGTQTTPRRRPGSTTIADIAQQTGVSVPTVSKVINGRSDVSAETRRRVEAAIREHGYRSVGREHGAAAPLLEVIFHELESEWALEIVRGVERVAGQHQLAVVLSEMQGRRRPAAAGSRASWPAGRRASSRCSRISARRCATSCGRAASRS